MSMKFTIIQNWKFILIDNLYLLSQNNMLKQTQIGNYLQLIRKIQNNKIRMKKKQLQKSQNKSYNSVNIIQQNVSNKKYIQTNYTSRQNNNKYGNRHIVLKSPDNILPTPHKKNANINQSINWLKRKNAYKKHQWIEHSNFKIPLNVSGGQISQSQQVSPRKINVYDVYCMEISKKRRKTEQKNTVSTQINKSKKLTFIDYPRKKKPAKLDFSPEIANDINNNKPCTANQKISNKTKTHLMNQSIKLSKIFKKKHKTQQNSNINFVDKKSANLHDYLKNIDNNGPNCNHPKYQHKFIKDLNFIQKDLQNYQKSVGKQHINQCLQNTKTSQKRRSQNLKSIGELQFKTSLKKYSGNFGSYRVQSFLKPKYFDLQQQNSIDAWQNQVQFQEQIDQQNFIQKI